MIQADSTVKPTQFGKYQIVRKIASGGMAEVYEAYRVGSENFQVRVALKCIRTELTANERFLRMFINEAHLGSQLHHPNIVEIQDFNRVDEIYYLAMEYVAGTDLAQFMQRVQQMGEPLPRPVILDIALQALGGLGYAHSARSPDGTPMNIVHRDLKPSNFLLSRQGTVKIADFGIAKASTNAYQTQTQDHIKGTLKYMSPEQVDGALLTPTSDIFSLAVILYELATFRELFDSPGIASTLIKIATTNIGEDLKHLDGIWPEFGEALRSILHRDPEKRPESSAEVIRTLRGLDRPYVIEGALERYLRRHPGLFEVAASNPLETLNIPKDRLAEYSERAVPPPAPTDQALNRAQAKDGITPIPHPLGALSHAASPASKPNGAPPVHPSPVNTTDEANAFGGLLKPARPENLTDAAPPPVMDLGVMETDRSPAIKRRGAFDLTGDFNTPTHTPTQPPIESSAEVTDAGVRGGDVTAPALPAQGRDLGSVEDLYQGEEDLSEAEDTDEGIIVGVGDPTDSDPPSASALDPNAPISSDYTFEESANAASVAPRGKDPFDPELRNTDDGAPASVEASDSKAKAENTAALEAKGPSDTFFEEGPSEAPEPAEALSEGLDDAPTPTYIPPAEATPEEAEPSKSKVGIIVLGIVILLGIVAGVAYLARSTAPTAPPTLQVKTKPPGAVIYLDGEQMVEKSPSILTLPVDRTQSRLKVEVKGFAPYEESLVFEAGQTLKRDIALTLLEVKPGILALETVPPGAQITLDGAPVEGLTPQRLDKVPAGIHSLTLTLEGFEPLTLTDLEILPGEVLQKELTLVALPKPKAPAPVRNTPRRNPRPPKVQQPSAPIAKGAVLVNSKPPDARVYVDGKFKGDQLPLLLNLPVGRHTLRLELGDEQKTHSFEVVEEERQTLVWDFTRGAWITR